MSRFNSIEQIAAERHRLERRAGRLERDIVSQYRSIRQNPFGDSRIVKIAHIVSRFGYLLPLLFKHRKK